MSFDFASVAAITMICYLVATAIKATPINNKWLPIICGVLGGILGVAAYQFGWAAIPAEDVLTAAAIGISSGFAATGVNQVGKQLAAKE